MPRPSAESACTFDPQNTRAVVSHNRRIPRNRSVRRKHPTLSKTPRCGSPASLAHLYALPNKIGLPADEYFIAQRIYAGWSLIGIPILGAIASTLALAVLVWHSSAEFRLIVTALACLVLALAIFFAFTFPANQATENWTARPADWETLRSQWEYSHAVGALLYLTALIALTLSLIVRGNRAENLGVRRDVDVG